MDEAPIKHTPGGEMPDTTEQHHVDPEELEALGGVEGEETTSNFMDNAKSYLPVILGAVGIGLGIYFLNKKYGQGDLKGRFTGFLKNRMNQWKKDTSEGDTASGAGTEGQRALDIDDVPPSRLMGA
jgi:hypothetical protein